MISISINAHFFPEKKYIIDVFFNVFLGLDYRVYTDPELKNYEIQLENGNKFIVEDHFFGNVKNFYLEENNIPEKIIYANSQLFPEGNLPVIYGTDSITEDQSEAGRSIISGVDIFASAFFMLTRWEEYVKGQTDDKERFLGKYSLAFQHNFLDRPVVNEYLEFLWNALKTLGIKQERKTRSYELIPTHDVDYLCFPKFSFSDLKNNLKFKGIKESIVKLKYAVFSDPYNTYDYLMKQGEKTKAKARFYFVDGQENYETQDYLHTSRFQKFKEKINKKDHVVGFHSGYYSFDNLEKAKKEKNRLENSLNQSVSEGRQHFLRFKVPDTWRILDQIGMKMDCTLGYHDITGFRCGVCYEFPVFDFTERKTLGLYEQPLIAMDTTLVAYNKLSPEQAEKRLKILTDQVKKYNGQFVLLWHNTAVAHGRWKKYKSVFERVYNQFT